MTVPTVILSYKMLSYLNVKQLQHTMTFLELQQKRDIDAKHIPMTMTALSTVDINVIGIKSNTELPSLHHLHLPGSQQL